MIELHCKVIKKWQPPHFYINPPFTGLSPLSSKNFVPPNPPQVTQFSEVLVPPLIREGGGGVPTMMNPNDVMVMVVVLKDVILCLLDFRFIYIVYIS